MHLSLLMGLVVLGSTAFGRPDWVQKARLSDSHYKYFVGRASGAHTEKEGISQTVRDAHEQAIRENYGIQTRFEVQAYESSEQQRAIKRAVWASPEVRLEGFEQVEFHVESRGGQYDVWALYRYPIAEIEKEKRRLAKLFAPDRENHFHFTDDEIARGSPKEPALWTELTRPRSVSRAIDPPVFQLSFWLPEVNSDSLTPQLFWGGSFSWFVFDWAGIELGYRQGTSPEGALRAHRFSLGIPMVLFQSRSAQFYFSPEVNRLFIQQGSSRFQTHSDWRFHIGYRRWWGLQTRIGLGGRAGVSVAAVLSYYVGVELFWLF